MSVKQEMSVCTLTELANVSTAALACVWTLCRCQLHEDVLRVRIASSCVLYVDALRKKLASSFQLVCGRFAQKAREQLSVNMWTLCANISRAAFIYHVDALRHHLASSCLLYVTKRGYRSHPRRARRAVFALERLLKGTFEAPVKR
jgi:hypothetical protein